MWFRKKKQKNVWEWRSNVIHLKFCSSFLVEWKMLIWIWNELRAYYKPYNSYSQCETVFFLSSSIHNIEIRRANPLKMKSINSLEDIKIETAIVDLRVWISQFYVQSESFLWFRPTKYEIFRWSGFTWNESEWMSELTKCAVDIECVWVNLSVNILFVNIDSILNGFKFCTSWTHHWCLVWFANKPNLFAYLIGNRWNSFMRTKPKEITSVFFYSTEFFSIKYIGICKYSYLIRHDFTYTYSEEKKKLEIIGAW